MSASNNHKKPTLESQDENREHFSHFANCMPGESPTAKYLWMYPTFLCLPPEYVSEAHLLDFPRNAHQLLSSPSWRKVYESNRFFELVITGMANLVWLHFEVKGSLESYSGYDPLWNMAYALPYWTKVLHAIGFSPERLLAMPSDYSWPFPSIEESSLLIGTVVQIRKKQSGLASIIQIVKEHRCHEDFDNRRSRAKIDFHRSFNHSRSKIKIVPIPQDSDISDTLLYDPTDNLCDAIDFNKFRSNLSTRDRKLVDLLGEGYTRAEIAEKIGYATHSAVVKRIKRIGKMYSDYLDETEALKEWSG